MIEDPFQVATPASNNFAKMSSQQTSSRSTAPPHATVVFLFSCAATILLFCSAPVTSELSPSATSGVATPRLLHQLQQSNSSTSTQNYHPGSSIGKPTKVTRLAGAAAASDDAVLLPYGSRISTSRAIHGDTKTKLKRRQLNGETLRTSHSQPRMSFDSLPPPPAVGVGESTLTSHEFGDELAASSPSFEAFNLANLPLQDMLILNNSLLNQQQPINLSTIEQILKLSPADLEFLDDSQLDLVNALSLATTQQQPPTAATNANTNSYQAVPIPLRNFIGQPPSGNNKLSANKTAAKVPKSLHSYVRRLASIYYPLASMLSPTNTNLNQQQQQAANQLQLQQQQLDLFNALAAANNLTAQQAEPIAPSSSSSSFSLASLVPKPKIDLSKSNISKKLNKLRIKSGRKYEPQQAAASNQQQQQQQQQPAMKRPTPANEINYDIFNNQLMQLEKQQKQLQALESIAASSAWPSPAQQQSNDWASTALSSPPSPFSPNLEHESLMSLLSDASAFSPGNSQFHSGPPAAMFQLNQLQMDNSIPASSAHLQTNGQLHHQQHRPRWNPPPALPRPQTTVLGPPTPLGQKPYVVDYMSMGHFNQAPSPTSPGQVDQQQQQAIFIKRIPQQHQQPQQQLSVSYPNIQPYSPPSDRPRSQISYLDSTDYSSPVRPSHSHNQNNQQQGQNQPNSPMSSMQTLAMSTHESQDNQATSSPNEQRQQQTQSFENQRPGENNLMFANNQHQLANSEQEAESLSGSGSGSHYAFKQQPATGKEQTGESLLATGGEMDHMLAIERFSKQSSERRPPSVVHPITGEQIIQVDEQQQQANKQQHLVNGRPNEHWREQQRQQNQQQFHSEHKTNHTQTNAMPKRFSSLVSSTSNRQQEQNSLASPATTTFANEILDTEQSSQAADLRRLNSSEQINMLNLANQHIQRPTSSPLSYPSEQSGRVTSSNRQSASTSFSPSAPTTTTTTTESSIPAVLIKPVDFDFFASDPPATATVISAQLGDNGAQSTTAPTTTLPSASQLITPLSSSAPLTGPLVPSFGPTPPTSSHLSQQQPSTNNEGELVFKSTLIEPIRSTLVPNHQNAQQVNSGNNLDSSPFVPIEMPSLSNSIDYFRFPLSNYNNNNQQLQLLPATSNSMFDYPLKPPLPLIDSIFNRFQAPFRPVPPVQVASYLAQHLISSNNSTMLTSAAGDRSGATNQPVSMNVLVATQQQTNTTTPNATPPSGNNYDQLQTAPSQLQQNYLPDSNQLGSSSSSNNNMVAGARLPPSDQLIILKPSILASRTPQTYVLKPEYLTSQFKPLMSAHSYQHSSPNNQNSELFYTSNELTQLEPQMRHLVGHQFDRLSSLSSPPSTSIALDPMQTESSSHNGATATTAAIVVGRPATNSGLSSGNSKSSGSNDSLSSDRSNTTSSKTTNPSSQTTPTTTTSQQRHIPGRLIPISMETVGDSSLGSLKQYAQDGGFRSNPGGDNTNTLLRDNNTDNAILSHVMSLISSNAIPTPPLIPVAGYSNADYFMPISDHRTHQFI